ncbi:hypothetical protein AB0D10_06135 [Kitasatospora sp. NPDC048545]|uniref:hypothetical protein n=1 Tax=Kitasatospora sp. NPDC048545 TaxID=3157208 RepID=UPI0033C562B6
MSAAHRRSDTGSRPSRRPGPSPLRTHDDPRPTCARPHLRPSPPPPRPVVVALHPEHAEAVPAVFQAGIDTGSATVGTRAPDRAAVDAAEFPDHRPVALDPAAPGARGPGVTWSCSNAAARP